MMKQQTLTMAQYNQKKYLDLLIKMLGTSNHISSQMVIINGDLPW